MKILFFLEQDPIQIPHSFSKKEDIEIAGFLVASIAWGNRISIIKNAKRMMALMDNKSLSICYRTQRERSQAINLLCS